MSTLVCFIRGDYHCVNRFIRELSSKYVIHRFNEADEKNNFLPGTKKDYSMPISVRYCPLGTWEIVFPESYENVVLTSILGDYKEIYKSRKWIYKFLAPLRIAMKLKKVPKYDGENYFPLYKNGVEVYPVGFKKDNYNENGHELL